MSEYYWEVAYIRDSASRIVLAENVPTSDLWAYFLTAAEDDGWAQEIVDLSPTERRTLARVMDMLKARVVHPPKPRCIAITRMDWTPEAQYAKWEADFYDVDKNGRRRRRYRRLQIEKDWEEMVKAWRREERAARAVKNASAS